MARVLIVFGIGVVWLAVLAIGRGGFTLEQLRVALMVCGVVGTILNVVNWTPAVDAAARRARLARAVLNYFVPLTVSLTSTSTI